MKRQKMKKLKSYTNNQSLQLKSHLESIFGESKLMSRNGGQLAVQCINPECHSRRVVGKKKLEFNLANGLYSCWTCGMKGILRGNSKMIIALSKRNKKAGELRGWLHENSLLGDRIPKEFIEGDKWYSGVVSCILGSEESEEEEGEEIDIENLSLNRLALARSRSEVWNDWNQRWADYTGNPEDSIRAAWGLDVRYIGGQYGYEYQVPVWTSDGRLMGIHVWRPNSYIRYQHVGEKSNFILGENLINWNSPVYLVEGLWDLVIGGPNSIALLGSTLPYGSRIEYLLAQKSPKVFVCLDKDAQDKAWKIAKNLYEMGIDVSVLEPPGKDPGDAKMPIREWSKTAKPKGWSWENSILEKLNSI